MERRQVALQKVSNGMGISEVVDFVSTEWGCSRRTARRDCHWALEELQLGLDTHDLAHLISHMATTLQRVSLKAEMSGQYASAIGAQRLLYDLLVSRRLDADAKKAERIANVMTEIGFVQNRKAVGNGNKQRGWWPSDQPDRPNRRF